MNAEDLRARQAPLKERYRADPSAATVPVHATADFRDSGITATVDGWAGPIRAGLHPATGGDGTDACSADLLMQALLGCVGTTLRSVSTAFGVELHGVELRADSSFDARGTLGVDRTVPVGIGPVTVTVSATTDADDSTLAKVLTATERFCVVGQSLSTPLTFHFERR